MLQGKRALVVGVANARSIAWGIADRWRREGADVFVTYRSERFRQPVEKLVRDNWGAFDSASIPATACDVTSEEDLARLWRTMQERGFCSSSVSGLPTPSPGPAGGPNPLGTPPGSSLASAQGAGGRDASAAAIEDILGRRKGDSLDATSVAAAAATAGAAVESMAGEEEEARELGVREAPRKTIDIVLHSVAHAPTDAMREGFVMGTSRDAFISAHVTSAYSLVSTVRHALPFLSPGASVVALTYIGSQRAATNYNVMGPAKASLEGCARALAAELGGVGSSSPSGIASPATATVGPGGVRVNCLSPGPMRTLASRGIAGFDEMRQEAAGRSPLGRGAALEEVAGVATFLASPLSSAVTGQTVFADCGFSAVV
eukprot:g11585.t2